MNWIIYSFRYVRTRNTMTSRITSARLQNCLNQLTRHCAKRREFYALKLKPVSDRFWLIVLLLLLFRHYFAMIFGVTERVTVQHFHWRVWLARECVLSIVRFFYFIFLTLFSRQCILVFNWMALRCWNIYCCIWLYFFLLVGRSVDRPTRKLWMVKISLWHPSTPLIDRLNPFNMAHIGIGNSI